MLRQDYLFSLPERLVRSAAAVVGGTSLLVTETLFPDVVKDSTTYRVIVGNLQKFMIARVAQVEYFAASEEERIIDGYIGRKLAGNVLEMAGLMTMRFSPVWVFALAGDAAAGSKVFLDRLSTNLKQHGVIDPESDPEDVVGLLDAIQQASSSSATIMDTPPLTREQLVDLAGDLTDGYGRMFSTSQSLLSRFEAIQSQMEQTAGDEGLSVEEVGGVMAIDVATLGKAGIGTTMAVGQTGAELFGEKILASYERTLDELNSQGAGAYLGRYMKPFMDAAVEHFDPNKSTWTQDMLLGRPAAGKPDVQESATGEDIVDKSMNEASADGDIPDESASEAADEASTG
ncbi:MAG: hypothetical protein JSW55_16060 [Chloroflexota bacterium]|nr:MAG: hypothetical protein JSW55_16060 [Chloroflexota bacterium]